MDMKVRRIATLLLLVLVMTGADTSARGSGLAQENSTHALSYRERLGSVVPEFEAGGRSMVDVVVSMAYRYKLPMAIEHVDRRALRRPVSLKFKHQSVRHILAAAVASVPGYRVEFSRGLVDIYSPAARSDPSNPLNAMISHYSVDGLDTHLADAELLCDLAREIHGHAGCGGSVASGQWGNRRITLHLSHRRVFEILNAIVAQNGEALWVPIVRSANHSGIMRNFWYIYPLDPSFEGTVVEGLRALLPRAN